MKFKQLTEQDKQYIKVTHSDNSLSWDTRMRLLMDRFDVSERTIRIWISKLGYSKYEDIESDELRAAKLKKFNKKSKKFMITWAQNATPVHAQFFKNMEVYAEEIGADIHVIAGRYSSTSRLTRTNSWWDEPVRPYLDAARHNIHPLVSVLSDVKVVPTATNPLTGFESVSGKRSSILGHPRLHLQSLPVLKGHPNKVLATTGACTLKNYTDTKAGKKGEFHHTYGFVVIEVEDKDHFHIRQVSAVDEDGSFIDLMYKVSDGEVSIDKDAVEAFICGDLHLRNLNWDLMDEVDRLVYKILKPKYVFYHDIIDGVSVNHHEDKDPIKKFHKVKAGDNIVIEEVNEVIEFLKQRENPDVQQVVVRSNHDVWLDRWVKEADWKKDVANAETYMKFAQILMNDTYERGLLPNLIDKEFKGQNVMCLTRDDSFILHGWELAYHGDQGSHGSKGTVNQFRKFNTKSIIGDYHKPERKDGVIGVGVFAHLRMGYNTGASGWMHSGAIIHTNGKAQLLTFVKNSKGNYKCSTLI